MANILIVEDDPELGPQLQYNIELEGHRATLATDGRVALQYVRKGQYQLLLLDWMIPGLDGLTVLSRLRADGIEIPVIMLTAKGREQDRLDGFREGCDDYVTKPFSLLELLSRIRAVLRRSGYRVERQTLRSDDLLIDPTAYTATFRNSPLDLTPKEFELLYQLVSHPRQTLSRNYLLEEVWGENCDITNRTIDNHVAALRKKLDLNPEHPSRIATVHKVGYRWDG